MTSTCRRRAPGEPGGSDSRPVTEGVSGRVQRGDGDDGEQRGDTPQERFDWTGRRQVEAHPVFVLFDLRRHLEEGEDQRGGLRSGQWGMRQRVGAEGMVEDVGSARQHEAHGVGEEGGRRGAVTLKIPLDRLASVCAIPPCAVAFFIHPLRRRRFEGGDHQTWMVASGPDCGWDHAAPGLEPRRGSRRALLIHPTAGGKALAMGLGVGGPLLGEPTRRRPDGRRRPEQDGMASHAEDTIDPAAMGQHLAHCGGSTMAGPTDEDGGPGPVPPHHGEETHHDHRIVAPRGACAWAQTGGHQGVCGPLANAERHIAITPGGVVLERAGLLAMGRGISMIEVEPHGGGRLGGAGDARIDQGMGKAVKVLAVDAVFQTGKGGGTRQGRRGFQGRPLPAERTHRVVPPPFRTERLIWMHF